MLNEGFHSELNQSIVSQKHH